MVLVRAQGLGWHIRVTISNLHSSLSGWGNLSPFYMQETEAQRAHGTGPRSHSEYSVNISSMQLALPTGMVEGAGPGSSSRSGTELEPKSSFPNPEDFHELLVCDVG